MDLEVCKIELIRERFHLYACWGGTSALRPTQRLVHREDICMVSPRYVSARAASDGSTFWSPYYTNCTWKGKKSLLLLFTKGFDVQHVSHLYSHITHWADGGQMRCVHRGYVHTLDGGVTLHQDLDWTNVSLFVSGFQTGRTWLLVWVRPNFRINIG